MAVELAALPVTKLSRLVVVVVEVVFPQEDAWGAAAMVNACVQSGLFVVCLCLVLKLPGLAR
jgi:hypothetical protein